MRIRIVEFSDKSKNLSALLFNGKIVEDVDANALRHLLFCPSPIPDVEIFFEALVEKDCKMWTAFSEDMTEYSEGGAETIAYVSDSGTLCLTNPSRFIFRSKLVPAEENSALSPNIAEGNRKLLRIAAYAQMLGKTAEAVKRKCRNGEINAIKDANGHWFVWSDTEYPEDKRNKKHS